MKKFLVIQLARFGDIIQSKRLIISLCHYGQVHVLVDKSMASLAKLVYPHCIIHSVAAHGQYSDLEMLKINIPLFGELQHINFTQIYNLNYAGLNLALAALFEPDKVRGYAWQNGQIVRSKWLNLAFRWMQDRRNAPLNLMDLWAWLLTEEYEPIAPEQVNISATGQGRGLGVVLAGRNPRRSLPPEYLAKLIHALFEAMKGPKIYLLGSQAETGLARKLSRLLSKQALKQTEDLSGRTNLEDLPQAIIGLDTLLSPDTGLMHLAAHLGVPVQGMFLSSAYAWETGPYGLGHQVWQSNLDCAPCLESSPCSTVHCLEAFKQPDFLQALSGRYKSALPESKDYAIIKVCSDFDSLGLIWQGHKSAQQTELRNFLAENKTCCKNTSLHLYQEADWMLPEYYE